MKRLFVVAGAVAVTSLVLLLALWLGAAGFDARRFDQHNGRLAKVMHEQPSADRLTQGLEAEGTPLLVTARSDVDKEQAARERGGPRLAELLEKAARYPELRVYRAGDMNYFVFFDEAGVMRDFTCVSR